MVPSIQESAVQESAAPWWSNSLIDEPVHVLVVLISVLALVFGIAQTPLKVLFKAIPILVFCYFVPTALSNTGVVPGTGPEGSPSFPLYSFISKWLLPSALLLMIVAVDLKGILKMGRHALTMFATAFFSIVLGGVLAYAILGWWFTSDETGDSWKGLAALAGSWIGGGANFVAIKDSVGASDSITGTIIVVDVLVANLWMTALLFFADRQKKMDAAINADTSSIDQVREKAEEFEKKSAKPTDLPALLMILAIGLGGTVIADLLAKGVDSSLRETLPEGHMIFDIASITTWRVVFVTAFGLLLSFTPVRRLEGKGASKIGSVFLYLLVASIGAKADFSSVFRPENMKLLAVGGLWMIFHVTAMLIVRRMTRSPIFFAAVGSKACIGGAASAPIVAAAFHPVLAPVGALLAIGGYVLGTIGGLAVAAGLRFFYGVYGGG